MILPFLALAFLLGVVGVATWDAPAWIACASLVLAAPGVYAWRGKRAALLVLLAASFALAGGYRFAAWENRPTPDLARYVGQSVQLEGRVASEPDPGRTTTRYRVDVDRVSTGSAWLETDGAVLVTLSQYASLDYGATVAIEGDLELPPRFDTFDYRGYLERQGIVATALFPDVEVLSEPGRWDLQSRLARSRLALDDSLQRALPEPHASLAGGIAFGRDGNLPDDLYDDFRASGLAHLVAVSGSNVMLVAAASFALLRPALGRKRAVWPVAFAVLAYLAIAGFSPSVLRAGLMAGVFLFGAALGRPSSGLAALAAAVIALLLFAPGLALDLGFQLSVSATAGLIAAGPWVHELLERGLRRIPLGGAVPAWVSEVAALSLCASVATFPFSWVAFGEVSLVSPLANIAVTPFLVFAFWSSIATALAGLAWEPAGWAHGLFAYYCLAGIIAVAELAASVPSASVSLGGGTPDRAILLTTALVLAGWAAYRYLPRTSPRPAITPRAQTTAILLRWGSLAAAVVIVAFEGIRPIGGPGHLEVTFLDVGQGDAILVTTPNGQQLLVDGGPSGIELVRELGAVMPHWDRTLDAVAVTHPQQDHLGGLPELSSRFDIGRVYDSGATHQTEAALAWAAAQPSPRTLRADDTLELDGIRLEVLWPDSSPAAGDLNDSSLVLLLTYGDITLLLTGDIEEAPQRALVEAGLGPVTVLKVPHHGSSTSWEGFFDALSSQVAVISVGADNPFGHPTDETLAALEDTRLYRTDLHGRVTIRSDGRTIAVTTSP